MLSGLLAIVFGAVIAVATFVPLGFLLRTMYRRGVIFATITGFCVSLLIELTQLTGVWWLFPCAYRLFDFTDLAMNTVGAAIGSLLAIAFTRHQRKTSTDAAPRVSASRRLLGMVSDVLFLALVGGTLGVFWRLAVITLSGREAPTSWSPVEALDQWMPVEVVLVSWLPLAIQLVFVMVTGTTIGERIVLLQPAATRLPVIPTRLLRFIGGIGLYGILSAVEFPLSDFLLFAFVVASIIMVFTTKNHRGLSYVVSAAELEAGSIEAASPENPKDANAGPAKAAK